MMHSAQHHTEATSPEPFGNFAYGIANTILHHWTNGEPVSILTLHEDGYSAGELIRFHFDAVELALEWLDQSPSATANQAMLASDIPLTPAQYTAQRGSTQRVA